MNVEENNLVSIITPAYNCEKYISQCIESVINQTYKNWEMIIVDDCSTDNTYFVVKKFAEKDKRIKVYKQMKNMGSAKARNKALEMSQGRFIAFLDADDMWGKDKLTEQIKFMLKNSYGFTFTSYEIVNFEKNIKKRIKTPSSINYNQYLKNTIIGCLTVMIDKKYISDLQLEEGDLEDVLTWMKYLRMGYTAYGLNENLAQYRVLSNSKSSNKLVNAKKYYICLRKYQELSLLKSLYCEGWYVINAVKKRLI